MVKTLLFTTLAVIVSAARDCASVKNNCVGLPGFECINDFCVRTQTPSPLNKRVQYLRCSDDMSVWECNPDQECRGGFCRTPLEKRVQYLRCSDDMSVWECNPDQECRGGFCRTPLEKRVQYLRCSDDMSVWECNADQECRGGFCRNPVKVSCNENQIEENGVCRSCKGMAECCGLPAFANHPKC
ncbi:hypothetical protein HK099_004502 [Clydaea vesicula]|uniref:Uncharacterized protein n=1 Tax=Clydaea vesicula TaxID=447962 RepID=A0AAD5U9Q3_9FUNG|nr:hypothetical protein HK099_004502 [Clydaea vesicula]